MKRKTPKSSKNRRIWSILNFNKKGTPKSSLIYQPIVGAVRATGVASVLAKSTLGP
jgi:hypothetical protein